LAGFAARATMIAPRIGVKSFPARLLFPAASGRFPDAANILS
jgi:hypothetical protein